MPGRGPARRGDRPTRADRPSSWPPGDEAAARQIDRVAIERRVRAQIVRAWTWRGPRPVRRGQRQRARVAIHAAGERAVRAQARRVRRAAGVRRRRVAHLRASSRRGGAGLVGAVVARGEHRRRSTAVAARQARAAVRRGDGGIAACGRGAREDIGQEVVAVEDVRAAAGAAATAGGRVGASVCDVAIAIEIETRQSPFRRGCVRIDREIGETRGALGGDARLCVARRGRSGTASSPSST